MFRTALVALSLSVGVASLGCAGTVSTEPPAAQGGATTRAPVAVAAHGPVKLFGEALGDVPLTTAQRTQIEQLAAAADARHATARAARKDLVLALADQVEAGAVDRAALAPRVEALSAALRAAQPTDRAALEQLHALLGADQRVAFADAVTARVHSHVSEMKGKHLLAGLADRLQLTGDQRDRIKAALGDSLRHGGKDGHLDFRGAKHDGEKMVEAFRQDRFVMDEVSPARDVGQKLSSGADHVLGVATAVLPILTPEQRAIAARTLREHAESPEEGFGL